MRNNIAQILPVSALPWERRHVYHYSFDGLGPARTLLLSEAWDRFGATATHYFLADPDWRFDLAPLATVAKKKAHKQIR
jgi:hypothetical protein